MTETITAPATDGTRDIDAAARDLAARMPASLGVLATIAYNYRWSWLPGGPELAARRQPPR